MSDPATGTFPSAAPAGDAWVTSLWQDMFTADTTSLLDGAITVTPIERPVPWRFVRQLALESDLPQPDVLRVVGNPHVATHENPYTLDIGVPMLLALDQADLAEVVVRVMTERGDRVDDAQDEEQRRSRFGRFGSRRRSDSRPTRPSGTKQLERAISDATQWWIEEFVHPDLTDNLVPRPVYLGLAELLGERGMEIADAAGLEPRPETPDNPTAGDPALFLLMDPDAIFENVAEAGLPPGTREASTGRTRWPAGPTGAPVPPRSSCSAAPSPRHTPWGGARPGRAGPAAQPRGPGPALRRRHGGRLRLPPHRRPDRRAGRRRRRHAHLLVGWRDRPDQRDRGPARPERRGPSGGADNSVVPFLRDILREYQVSPDWTPSDDGTGDDRALAAFLQATGRRQAPGTGFLHGA